MKKKILVLNYEFPPLGGGAAPVSYDIAKVYVDAGYDVDVVTMGFGDLRQYEEKNGIHIYRVRCIRKKKEVCEWWEQITYIFSGYYKIKKLLKEKKYNFCHCHFLLPTGILALLIKKKFGINYMLTAHGSDVPGYNPDRFTFIHKFTPPLLKTIINNSELVTCPSKYLANLIKNNISGVNKSIQIIPNGIDTNRFIPGKKEKIIVSTGRLWPLKGIHLLAQAFSEIQDTNGFELHICGDGPLMNKIKTIQSKTNNTIVLHGWMDNNSEEYVQLLGKSMIYCLPSVSESGSLGILEGMSSGCTILTTDMGVCSEMAKDVGYYVEPNVDSIKSKLEYLIGEEKSCLKGGIEARKKTIKCYDKPSLLGCFIEVAGKYVK